MHYYKTVSLDLAAFLLAEDCQIASLGILHNKNQVVFCFFQTLRVGQLVTEFYGLTALVSPQKFIQARQNLKSAIVAKKESGNVI